MGLWLAALEDGRADTLKELDGVTSEMVDWYPDAPLNSIGTLLYHIALIEAAWVVEEILERDDEPTGAWRACCRGRTAKVPVRVVRATSRESTGNRSRSIVARLATVRAWVLDQLRPMTNDDFHRVRSLRALRRGAQLGSAPPPPARG